MAIGKRRMIRFPVVNGHDTAVEFPALHRPRVTANRSSLSGCDVRPGQETPLNPKPLERAGSGRVAIRVAFTRPGGGVSGLGVVVPNERFLAVLGALIGAGGIVAARANQCQQD